MRLALRTAASSVLGIGAFMALLFVPAGTWHYWQGWAFIAVFATATLVPSVYLARRDPDALKRRMKAGPTNETRPVQRIVIAACFLVLPTMMVLAGLDHRLGWSAVPFAVVVFGDVLVGTGLVLSQWAVIQNSYAAATITIERGQSLVSTGLYGAVRHPLYVGALTMMVGAPLALGSWWPLVLLIPGVGLLVVRILDEEHLLAAELVGYTEYRQQVRYRLVPHVW